MSLATTALVARVFRSSTPQTRPDWAYENGARWRVSDREALMDLVNLLCGPGFYAEPESSRDGHARLFVGSSTHADDADREARCLCMMAALARQGLQVEGEVMDGDIVGVLVVDRLTRAEA